MNRCTLSASATSLAMLRCVLAPLALTLLACNAQAQESIRNFPANALRGTMQITQPPELLMDGRALRLSPGARIKNANNLLLLSGHLVGRTLTVNYVRDPQGLVHEVWLLNATEARQPMASAAPTHNYVSEHDNPAPNSKAPGGAALKSSTQP